MYGRRPRLWEETRLLESYLEEMYIFKCVYVCVINWTSNKSIATSLLTHDESKRVILTLIQIKN